MTQPTDDIKLPALPEIEHWLNETYTAAQMREYARAAVLADRERQRQKLPANWDEDSSLETWFPITAEELRKLRKENAELRKDAMGRGDLAKRLRAASADKALSIGEAWGLLDEAADALEGVARGEQQ